MAEENNSDWTPIKGFEDYLVNKKGEVYSTKRNKLLKQYLHKGYCGVYLYNRDGRKYKLVHRLVAEAYIPNDLCLPQVNYKDENTTNNCYENLEWCTQLYNANYGTLKQRNRERMLKHCPNKGKKHTPETIEKMRKARIGKPGNNRRRVMINGVEFESVTKAMEVLQLSTRRLYKILEGI